MSRSHISSNRNPRKGFPTSPDSLGKRIRAARLAKGLLQSELAHMLGVSKYYLTQWEADRGTPNEAQLMELSRFLDIPTSVCEQEPNG